MCWGVFLCVLGFAESKCLFMAQEVCDMCERVCVGVRECVLVCEGEGMCA